MYECGSGADPGGGAMGPGGPPPAPAGVAPRLMTTNIYNAQLLTSFFSIIYILGLVCYKHTIHV